MDCLHQTRIFIHSLIQLFLGYPMSIICNSLHLIHFTLVFQLQIVYQFMGPPLNRMDMRLSLVVNLTDLISHSRYFTCRLGSGFIHGCMSLRNDSSLSFDHMFRGNAWLRVKDLWSWFTWEWYSCWWVTDLWSWFTCNTLWSSWWVIDLWLYKCTAPGPRCVTADRPDGGLDELWLLLLDDPSGLLLQFFRACNARDGGGCSGDVDDTCNDSEVSISPPGMISCIWGVTRTH